MSKGLVILPNQLEKKLPYRQKEKSGGIVELVYIWLWSMIDILGLVYSTVYSSEQLNIGGKVQKSGDAVSKGDIGLPVVGRDLLVQ